MHRFLLLTSLLLGACADLGDRASSGACPAGETCSPTTPSGLEFSGTGFSDGWLFDGAEVKVTAVGGTQPIGLRDHATQTALAVPFTAAIDGDALEVVATDGPRVTVAGLADGRGTLQIRDEDGLLDQLDIAARPVETFGLGTSVWSAWRTRPERPWLAYEGAEALLVVQLYDAGGGRLVDTSTTIAAPGAIQDDWDSIETTVTSGLALTVEAGDREPVTIAVPTTDRIGAVRGARMTTSPVSAGGIDYVCFEAELDDADVLFAPWTFEVTGPATLGEPGLPPNCAFVEFDAPGVVTVRGSTGGLSTTVTVDVGEAARVAPAPPSRVDGAPSLGERAGSADS